MESQRGIEETCLCAPNSIGLTVLLWGAVPQRFMQLIHRFCVDEGDFAAFESCMVLAGKQEPLDLACGEGFAAGGLEKNSQVEPLHARGGDLELGFDALEILACAAVEPFLEAHVPLAFQFGEFTGEEI